MNDDLKFGAASHSFSVPHRFIYRFVVNINKDASLDFALARLKGTDYNTQLDQINYDIQETQ